MTALKGTPAPTLPDLRRAAAEAITVLCATLRDCAREVEARDGQRVARDRLHIDKETAINALRDMFPCLPGNAFHDSPEAREVTDMAVGCRAGYVRPTWALRLMQLAADAPEPRDTMPAEAPLWCHSRVTKAADCDGWPKHPHTVDCDKCGAKAMSPCDPEREARQKALEDAHDAAILRVVGERGPIFNTDLFRAVRDMLGDRFDKAAFSVTFDCLLGDFPERIRQNDGGGWVLVDRGTADAPEEHAGEGGT